MTGHDRLYDSGTAPERTALAWTRTGLALLAATAFTLRLLVDEAAWLVGTLAALGVGAGVLTLLVGRRRYADVQDALWAAGPGHASAVVGSARAATGVVATAVVALSVLLVVSVLSGPDGR